MRFDAHVQDICCKAYIDIRRISYIRHVLSIDATKSLLSVFVQPRLDYCNSLIYRSLYCTVHKFFSERPYLSSKTNFSVSQTNSHFTPSDISALAVH